MDLLPELALVRIFDHLPLYDRLAGRLVCKQWKRLIEEHLTNTAKELVLFYLLEPRPLVWHHNDRQVDLHNAVVVNHRFRSSQNFKRLFGSIKRLYIVSVSSDITFLSNIQTDFFDHVNCFCNLEHFELYQSKFLESCPRFLSSFKIDLKELKELKTFYYETERRDQLASMVAPKLEQLTFFGDFRTGANFDCFKNSLKVLKVRSFFHMAGFELPNLELLYFSTDLQIEISAFEKLKEIHWYFGNENQVFLLTAEPIRTIFNDLFEQRSRLKRKLLFYFDGHRCEPDSLSTIVTMGRIYQRPRMCNILNLIIRKEDLKLYQQNHPQNDDLRLERMKKCLVYSSELDEVIGSMSDQHLEKLARSLAGVLLMNPLNPDLLANSKLQTLLKYVQHVSVHAERFPRDQLELLPGIVPGLVNLNATREMSPDWERMVAFRELFMPCSLAIQFKGLKSLAINGEQTSPDELGQILDACRYHFNLFVYSGEFELTFCKRQLEEQEKYFYSFNQSMMNRVLKAEYPNEAASLLDSVEGHRFLDGKMAGLYGKEQVIDLLLRYDFLRIN